MTARPSGRPASTHARALITWLAVYPVITVLSVLLAPATHRLPLALNTFVLTALTVPLVVYVLVPALLRARNSLMRYRKARNA